MKKTKPSDTKKRFLIVEDHPLYRDAIGLMIQHWIAGAETVGVDSVDEAKKALLAKKFDLVILDLELEDRSGLDLLEECKFMEDPPAVLVVSGHTRSDYVTRVLRLGAVGYVSKSAQKDELQEAIHTVFGGRLFLSKDVARTVAEATIRNRNLPAHAVLSGRELEVFLMLARGLQPKEIAAALNLSVRTVAVHKFKAFQKTGVRNLVELFRYCQEHRLLKYETTGEPYSEPTAN
jgi:DNA-binding NarL/FixJ family response regulator